MYYGMWLQAGDVVPMDNGRFQLPVRDLNRPDELSSVVFKISSEAFHTVEEAEAFADLLIFSWNARSGPHT